MSSTRRKQDLSEGADTFPVYSPGAEELARVLKFLGDKTSPFARIVPARPVFDGPRPAKHRVLPW